MLSDYKSSSRQSQSESKLGGDNMPWFLLVFLLSVAVFYILKIWKSQTYWKRKGIAYDVPVPLFGMMLDVLIGRKSLFESLNDIYRANPDSRYVGFYQFTTPTLLLRDPELIKQMCIKDFEALPEHRLLLPEGTEPLWTKNIINAKYEKWRRLRPTLTPAFTSSKMRTMFNSMEECSRQLVSYFVSQQSDTIDVELKDIFTRYTNDVIAANIFGVQVDSLKDRNNEFYRMGKSFATVDGVAVFKLFLYGIFTTPMKLLDIRLIPRKVTAYFNSFFKEAVKQREENNFKGTDIIQLLIDARTNDKGKKLDITDEEITAQLMIFFLGGFETVSTALCFAVYELALQPDIQERLHQEIDEVWQKTEGKPTMEDIAKMTYLDMVFSENLRKNTPMVIVDRRTVRPYTIQPTTEKEKPLTLETGTQCLYSVCSLHWDENYFPNPRKFDPERFSEENKHKIQPGTYVPFGMGPRNCIGARFATMEIKSALFHLIRSFEVIPNKKTDVPLELLKDSLTLAPKNGFHLSFKKRTLN